MGASLIIRRIHLYLALFLTPWMLMYAISTVVMNHRGFFKDYYGEHAVQWEIESDTTYDVMLGPNISREVVANQILSHLGIEGAHNTQGRLDRRITITRDNPWATRRVTFSPASGNLKVERRMDRVPVILESLHRRRGGYQHPIVSEHLWSVVIDLVIVAMMFWAGSGVWMWWEMSITRRLGAITLVAGLLLYAFFLVAI
jgi:hypothetical protein